MFFLTPRYLKHARLLHKGASRFLNYKRDLLPATKVNEIESLRTELEQSMKRRDAKRIEELSKQLTDVCHDALPDIRHSDLADNIEVFFVAIIIALGIRAYIVQPFKIPTGSMQPTLNGIIAKPMEDDEPPPGFVDGWFSSIFRGQSYINAVSDHDGRLRRDEPIKEVSYLGFFTHCNLYFEDGHVFKINAPLRQLTDPSIPNLGLLKNLSSDATLGNNGVSPDGARLYQTSIGGRHISKGQVLARGILITGDHVLVDKFSYHFRAPKRGEVFVFTTKHIYGIEVGSGSFDPRQGSQHYIKRLAAVPGDHFEVRPPELWIGGKPAEEFGTQRVGSAKDGYDGYATVSRDLHFNQGTLNPDQYLALGDNSYNSFDSRYWGPVPQRNLVGPALFCYWPPAGHWGSIK